MASLILVLENRRATKEGKYPLLFRIGLNRKYAYISTGIYLFPEQFNTVKGTIPDDVELSIYIKKLETEYLEKLHSNITKYHSFTDPLEIKSFLLNKLPDEITIAEFWEEHVANLNNSGRNGGARVYNSHPSKIGKMLETNEAISSYVFRYSYANIAKQLGYSKDLIAEALGHEYGNSVTGIYLEQFDLGIVDDMNYRIINAIISSSNHQ